MRLPVCVGSSEPNGSHYLLKYHNLVSWLKCVYLMYESEFLKDALHRPR